MLSVIRTTKIWFGMLRILTQPVHLIIYRQTPIYMQNKTKYVCFLLTILHPFLSSLRTMTSKLVKSNKTIVSHNKPDTEVRKKHCQKSEKKKLRLSGPSKDPVIYSITVCMWEAVSTFQRLTDRPELKTIHINCSLSDPGCLRFVSFIP